MFHKLQENPVHHTPASSELNFMNSVQALHERRVRPSNTLATLKLQFLKLGASSPQPTQPPIIAANPHHTKTLQPQLHVKVLAFFTAVDPTRIPLVRGQGYGQLFEAGEGGNPAEK